MTRNTTADGERAARTILRTDWDADGTASVHLPADAAVDLLDRRGWTYERGYWRSPNGERYWVLAEALQVALLAEVAELEAPPKNAVADGRGGWVVSDEHGAPGSDTREQDVRFLAEEWEATKRSHDVDPEYRGSEPPPDDSVMGYTMGEDGPRPRRGGTRR